MTDIWSNDGTAWKRLPSVGFSDEAALHGLIESAPELLPLAGSPTLSIIGRETILGTGKADLLAVESSGRLAIIEIKLAKNPEARRAVVAQVLAYAAYLHGLSPATLEHDLISSYLRQHDHESLAAAAASSDQIGSFDAVAFNAGLAQSLGSGEFRLVLVLDSAPDELVHIIGYLESVRADRLLIDLVTVSAYEIGGSRALIPQHISPEREPADRPAAASSSATQLVPGADDFIAAIDAARPEHRQTFKRLTDWALQLEHEGLVFLHTYHGKTGRLTLLPRLRMTGSGLVTIYNDNNKPYMTPWRSLFLSRAPRSLPSVEELVPVGQGNTVNNRLQLLMNRRAPRQPYAPLPRCPRRRSRPMPRDRRLSGGEAAFGPEG